MTCIINEKTYKCSLVTVEYRTGERVNYDKQNVDVLYINLNEIKSVSIIE